MIPFYDEKSSVSHAKGVYYQRHDLTNGNFQVGDEGTLTVDNNLI